MRMEGPHYKHDDMEFWAEDGLIYMEDRRNGEFNVITCYDIAKRAKCLNDEAKRAYYQVDRDNLNDWVNKIHSAWKEAKAQGDPSDIKVALERYKERRKAVLITGFNW